MLAIVAAFAALGQAQPERQLRLPPANAELSEEFTTVGSVRELSGGRLLVTDPREGRVVLVDLKSGLVQQVGRKGQGPNEYGNAGPLIPLAADSSLMIDFMCRRWLLFAGPAIVATLPPDTPIIKAIKTFARGVALAGGRRRTPRAAVAGGLHVPGRAPEAARVRRCVRIWLITADCVMHATIRIGPAQRGHASGSTCLHAEAAHDPERDAPSAPALGSPTRLTLETVANALRFCCGGLPGFRLRQHQDLTGRRRDGVAIDVEHVNRPYSVLHSARKNRQCPELKGDCPPLCPAPPRRILPPRCPHHDNRRSHPSGHANWPVR